MSDTCEKGTKLYGYNIEKANKYCRDNKKPHNTIVKPYHSPSISSRFYKEKWVNICNEKECNLEEILNPRNSRNKHCYPTEKLDDMTGKLKSEISKDEWEKICEREYLNEIPSDILMNVRMGQWFLQNGAKRYYKSEIEDFTISEDITVEMLYLWKCWIDLHGPDYGKMCLYPETTNSKVIYPNNIIRPINYYFKYKKWVANQSGRKIDTLPEARLIPEGALEWLLKGGNEAYIWLKSKWVKDRILEKYPWVCFDDKNRL